MATIDEVERLFRHLVDVLSQSDPDRLKSPIQISEIYQTVVPYRHHRSALGFDTNEDYEMAVLRFLAGDGGFATIDPPEVQDALAQEAQSINPNPSAFREYAAARVYLNSGAVRTVTEAQEAYAPPPSPEAEEEDPALEFSSEERDPFVPDPDVLDLTTAKMTAIDVAEGVPFAGTSCLYCGEDVPVERVVKFCPFCGRDLRMVSCPACGADLEASWRYCITCGDSIGT
ncbi:MAG: zinc ribbon domain-containing protein [Gemmatimonadetes bacterium]|nr:zinc ribbon domain-containing protein [Gemmatimonadota bacterium]